MDDNNNNREPQPKPFDRSILDRIPLDEPVFVLRAQDLSADYIVERWANAFRERGGDAKKYQAALDIAAQMRGWKPRKYPD